MHTIELMIVDPLRIHMQPKLFRDHVMQMRFRSVLTFHV